MRKQEQEPVKKIIICAKVDKQSDVEYCANQLKAGIEVIVDFNRIKDAKERDRLVSFMNGAAFGHDAEVTDIALYVFLYTPHNVEVAIVENEPQKAIDSQDRISQSEVFSGKKAKA